jgi:hypothetical protein
MAADSCWMRARSSATVWGRAEDGGRGGREKTGLASSDALDERWGRGERGAGGERGADL